MLSNVCFRSHGQPPGARSRAMISTSSPNFAAASTDLDISLSEENFSLAPETSQRNQAQPQPATPGVPPRCHRLLGSLAASMPTPSSGSTRREFLSRTLAALAAGACLPAYAPFAYASPP